MNDELYTDGIDEITVGGGIVRVDLFSLSPFERDANNLPKRVFRQRLIFSVQAFANSFAIMQNAIQGLIEAGAIERSPRAVDPQQKNSSDRHAEPASTITQRSSNVSSNFG